MEIRKASNCFPPIARRDATTLVLGSLPGRRSLEMQQYYAHPQNSFWRIVEEIFETDSPLPYTRRAGILTAHRVALWDVLAAAERPGSLDASIVHASASANDFGRFFRRHPAIRRVFFNGRMAEELYRGSYCRNWTRSFPAFVTSACHPRAPPTRV